MTKVRNFLFHRVNPKRDLLWDPMDVKLFDSSIAYIKKKFDIITIEDIPSIKNNKKNHATISFDDGYKDNIDYALPILEKYNIKASFYVVTNCIDYNIPTWTYILDYLFTHTKHQSIHLNFDFLPQAMRDVTFNHVNSKIEYAKKLKPLLKTLNHSQRSKILQEISLVFNDVELPKIMMNWDDLRKLYSLGHKIGSHTTTHNMLGTISDESEIRFELENSRNRIKEKLGFFPATISYPIGSYNDTVIRISQELGYSIGLAVKQKIYNSEKDSIFDIPRIELYNESWLKTYLRINHTLENIKRIIKYK